MQLPHFIGRVGEGILVLLTLLMGVFGISALFVTVDPLPHDAQFLVATAAVGMMVLGLGVILGGLRRGQRWAWLVLWYYPVFFLIHVYAFGTLIPDGIFAVLAAVSLLVTRPGLKLSAGGGERSRAATEA
jgi:hypothetical protein